MKRILFIVILSLVAIAVFARQVESTNTGIANASPGDYIIRSNGTRYVLNQGDINYARSQLGLSVTNNNQSRATRTNSSSGLSSLNKFILLIIGAIVFVIWIQWAIGKAIGKRLSRETGTVLGVILIVMGVSLFIGIPIIIYSRGPKQIGIY